MARRFVMDASRRAPSPLRTWLLAIRLKTLPAAVVPVVVGTSCAHAVGHVRWLPSLAALLGALLLQIGSNLANDVYDHEKGADTHERQGPLRVVSAGLVTPGAMRVAMLLVFALASLVGAYLTAVAGPAIVVIGLASIASAILYTGGPYPLGYHGLGDVFVLLFFGFVAVCGTAFVNLGRVPIEAVLLSVPVGALATAILVVNNVRDVGTDSQTGKRTLVVRLGRKGGVVEYALLLAAAYFTVLVLFVGGFFGLWILLPLVTAPVAWRLLASVKNHRGPRLNATLAGTARLLLLFGVLLGVGVAVP
jgi:1,4-dihydroxy-2-naphthoate octaprenyltransferase